MAKFYKFYTLWVNIEKKFLLQEMVGEGGGGADAIYIYVALYFICKIVKINMHVCT